MSSSITDSKQDIAIIGMAGRFPGANNIAEFWQNLRQGIECISFFSDEELVSSGIDQATLQDPNYVKAAGTLNGIELFDASFFNFSPREAEIMDPQHRLFLEAAWEALETAGYNSDTYPGRIGVYAGAGMNTYLLFNLYSNPQFVRSVGDFQTMIGNDKDFLPTRVSYKLNLRGPSINVQTACSTSLVAICLACQSLLNYQSDIALAGGVSIRVPNQRGYFYQPGGILSPDGHCRAFDAKAQGTVIGSGLGIVVLKRLEEALQDRDCIHAVIKGSAINNDGALKAGYTAPSIDGQAEVIMEACAMAEIPFDTISYIETHGTGTTLGDPIEIAALNQIFRTHTKKRNFCAIGSVKTNVGHLDTAAGVAGLIKTVLALKHKQLPPSLHFESPNPQLDLAHSPFYVNNRLTEWQADLAPLRAGVSSFGIGGTNVHVVVEEAPIIESAASARSWQLLLLSAKTATALETTTANLAEHLREHTDLSLADVAYTYQIGRKAFNYRRFLVCRDLSDAVCALKKVEPNRLFTAYQKLDERPVIFMFPGGGAQYVNMGRELYQVEPIFREQVDHCLELLRPQLGFDLSNLLYPNEKDALEISKQLRKTSIALPALFSIEYALAKLWISWGIRPQAMIGHSLGEYTAACLAGVISLEDALSLVVLRGRLFEQLPEGGMLSVSLSQREVAPLLNGKLSLAAINGPALCVVSGMVEEINELAYTLSEREVEFRHLQIDVAAHSHMVTPILKQFTEFVKRLKLNAPSIPYLSNVTGNWISPKEAMDANYWARHLRETVRFADGLQELLKDPDRVLLEVGPGQTLSTLARLYSHNGTERVILSSLRHPQLQQSDLAFLFHTLGKLWLAGVKVDWSGFSASEQRHRVPLPTYPFERVRYWIEPKKEANHLNDASELQYATEREDSSNTAALSVHSRHLLQDYYVAPSNKTEQVTAEIWENLLGITPIGINDNFFELGGHSLLATQVISRVRDLFQVELPLRSLFEMPTVAGLADRIESIRLTKQASWVSAMRPVPRDIPLPLSFAQQRLWFIDQLVPGNPFYNIPGAVRLFGLLDV
ncbi:MAG: beta-ketoacyl synthase N-terminal-like domain-containing protein, partial [Acidobacteriota bacterium]